MYDYYGWWILVLLNQVASLPTDALFKKVKTSYPSIA